MELASMLAGERFSDHPRSVCPVIGAFLRRYNDSIDDRLRQDLYGYAAKVVGSRACAEVERARIARLIEWTRELRERRRGRLALPRRRPSPAKARAAIDPELVTARSIRVVRRHGRAIHEEVLAFIDELLAIRGSEPSVAFGFTAEDALVRSGQPR